MVFIIQQTEGFKAFLKSMNLELNQYVEDGVINFDLLNDTLQMLDKKSSLIIHEPVRI